MRFLLIVFVTLFLLAGCSDDNSTNPENQTYESFEEIKIPNGFEFSTTNNIQLNILSGLRAPVAVTGNDGIEYNKFTTDETGYTTGNITIPSTVTSLNFTYLDNTYTYDINPTSLTLDIELFNATGEIDEDAKYVGNYIVPILDGIVHNDDGSITAHWGYVSYYANNKNISIGYKNNFTGVGITDEDQGQPTTFSPGFHHEVFTVDFTPTGDERITWLVKTRRTVTAYADANSRVMPGPDEDGDEIPDDEDDYPSDPNKAYDNYYPSEGAFGTLMYEDLWPNLGDHDFNDLVIEYNMHEIEDSWNDVVEVNGTLKLIAIGASKQNGFFIELPFWYEDVTLVESYIEGTSLQMELFTYDDELAILKVFNNTNDLIQLDGTYMNTIEAEPVFDAIEMTFKLTIDYGYKSSKVVGGLIYSAPYNPYLTIDHDATREIHLPGLPPTSNADVSIFGTGDDATNVDDYYFYQTASGIPWALDITSEIKYPQEYTDVVIAFPQFGNWVNSNGGSFTDWYDNPQIDKVYDLQNK
ncbi:MAG: hypothetical protein B6226_01835 [Candidatus Cloacimonetes bacterium 4572_65]|nr:MAG: hypothetical protein B6226_01835 [Candidatus Cloacimonetes bacterium 4572_65]